MRIILPDAWYVFGSYSIFNEQGRKLAYVKLSNGFIGRLNTNIFDNDNKHIGKIYAPTVVATAFRQQLWDPEGNVIGHIEPRLTVSKLITSKDKKPLFDPYRSNTPKGKLGKWYRGTFGDLVFRNRSLFVETSWPFFQEVKIFDGDHLIIKFTRTIKNYWIDFFIIKELFNLPYEKVEVWDDTLTEKDSLMIILLVRQWLRHFRKHHP